MDAGGDLVALCDLGGPPVPGGSADTARVVGQWTYDAYGAVLSADHLHAMALPHLGHKGLFLDRLDVGIVTGPTGPESPRLVPYAHSLYHNRNRAYSPALGRFFQRDPNAMAMSLLSMSSTGRGFGAIALAFSMEDMYGDGMNLYEYLGSNPWNRNDPLGLSWDPFSIVDDFLAERTGSAAAFLNQIGQDAVAIAVVGANIASYMPFPIVGNLGDLALYALGEIDGEEFAMATALGLAPGGKLLRHFSGFIGKLGASAWRSAKHYASKHGASILKAAGGPALWVADRALKYIRKGCGCFESGTTVWTLRGPVPIEQVTTDDHVFARDESSGELSIRRVLRRFVRDGAPIVAITITTAAGAQQTLRTTAEHPFYVDGRGWTAAHVLAPGDAVTLLGGGLGTVGALHFMPDRATVYNFEVEGVHNYFVGAGGVLVHNMVCDPVRKIASGHAWTKHADDWRRLGIRNQDELTEYLTSVSGRGRWKSLSRGRDAWIDDSTGVVLITDPGTRDFGTAFIPGPPLFSGTPQEYFANNLR